MFHVITNNMISNIFISESFEKKNYGNSSTLWHYLALSLESLHALWNPGTLCHFLSGTLALSGTISGTLALFGTLSGALALSVEPWHTLALTLEPWHSLALALESWHSLALSLEP